MELAGLAQIGQVFHEPVREVDRHRHQLFGFGAGISEHDSLVAGALFGMKPLTLGDALRDVRRLGVNA